VTVERGHDPRDFLLVVGGGAGPVHAAGIAAELGLSRILVPRRSAIFCAVGLVLSDLRHDLVRSHVTPFDRAGRERLAELARELAAEGRRALASEGATGERVSVALSCDVRYLGQYHEVTVPWLADEAVDGDLGGIAKRFHEAHDRLYGYALPDAPLELVNLRGAAVGLTDKPALPELSPTPGPAAPRGRRRAWLGEERRFAEVPVYDGEALGAGARLAGPGIVELDTTTIVLPAGWRAQTDRHGSFLLEREGA
jgi:N-methylhydantoinase A